MSHPSDSDRSVVIGEPTVFRNTGAILVESPYWADGTLYWVDISTGELHCSPADGAVDGSDDTVFTFPPPMSAVQPVTGGGWIVALQDRVVVTDASGAIIRELATMPQMHAGLRMNEGKCDPQGRFVVGSMNLTTDAPDGAWYRIDTDGTVLLLEGGVSIANGLEWSLDEQTIYFTDTVATTIYRAPWREDGLGEVEPFSRGGLSDGLAIDVDGYFWNAHYQGGCVVRLDPDGREVLRVDVPAPNVTGIGFGGDDLSTLFIGTAREHMEEADLERWPASGGIFALQTATHGRPVRSFGPLRPAGPVASA